jgi:hypothetical protein
MVVKEYKKQAGVYKVQTFGTTQSGISIVRMLLSPPSFYRSCKKYLYRRGKEDLVRFPILIEVIRWSMCSKVQLR